MKRFLPFVPLGVIALLGVLFATYGLHHNPQVFPAALVGKPLPKEVLPTLDGADNQPIAAAAAAKGPVLVNLFASWCVPCVEEAPQLLNLKAHGVPVIGVAFQDDPAKTLNFLDRYGDPYSQILVDRSGAAGVDFGISGVPETFVVDRKGMIVGKHVGPMTDDDALKLARQVESLRQQPG